MNRSRCSQGTRRWGWAIALALACWVSVTTYAAEASHWVTAWTTATFAETPGKDTPELRHCTVRQVVRVTLAGTGFRVRFGNFFGTEPLQLGGARVAIDGPDTAKSPREWHPLAFGGHPEAIVPAGQVLESDAVALPVPALAHLVIETYVDEMPKTLTVHSAARSNSYTVAGNVLSSVDGVPATHAFTRWYFLAGVDVLNDSARSVAVLGDSIADGYGCPPDSYARWADVLATRLQADQATRSIGVLNVGIGGNRLLRDGLGPRALSRVDRDVFAQHGVTAVILCLGINDIGTRVDARKKNQPYASAEDIIAGLRELVQRSRQHGLRVIGATMTPYAGAKFYWSEDGEQDRQAVNDWIRHGGAFDAVIDFDAVVRDPAQPTRLDAHFDSGDHLHPSVAGYAEMGRSVALTALSASAVPVAH